MLSQSLHTWFNSMNTCPGSLTGNTGNQMAQESDGGDIGSLIENEPLVHNYNDNSNLWINAGNSNDFNRFTTVKSPGGNLGHGLGTHYDQNECSDTARPMADAEMHNRSSLGIWRRSRR